MAITQILVETSANESPLLLLVGDKCTVATVLSAVQPYHDLADSCDSHVLLFNETVLQRDAALATQVKLTFRMVFTMQQLETPVASVSDLSSLAKLSRRHTKQVFCVGRLSTLVWLKREDIVKSDSNEQQIASSLFADVYRGIYQGKPVALKYMYMENAAAQQMEYTLLAAAQSRHVVRLLGLYFDDGNVPVLVCEFAENGTLLSRMRDDEPITVDIAIEWFRQATVAIARLHTLTIVHCDVKANNLLLDGKHRVRLCDFGSAQYAHRPSPVVINNAFYCAPEQLCGEKYTYASDIYALALLLWELHTRATTGCYIRAFKNSSSSDIQHLHLLSADEAMRPMLTEETPQNLRELMQAMWHARPAKRPPCSFVLNQLANMDLN